MLGFSCSACAPNSNISQREAYSPLAISFSHRAKVTWLTTVSHLTMQKDYQFAGLLSGGEASSLSPLFNRRSIVECCRTPEVVCPYIRYSARKVLLSLSLFCRCIPNHTCVKKNMDRDAFWLFSNDGSFTSSHSPFLSFTSPSVHFQRQGIGFIFIASTQWLTLNFLFQYSQIK